MFLHLGDDFTVRKKNIIGIFDIDNTKTPKATAAFLKKCQTEGKIITVGYDLPKSFVLVKDKKGERIILSHISAKTLLQRTHLPLT